MTKIWQNTTLVSLSLNFKVCLRTSILGKRLLKGYTDMEELDFQILLTDNYYINANSIHICFPIKIKKKNNTALDIDADLITVNNFFTYFVKEISVTKHGSKK